MSKNKTDNKKSVAYIAMVGNIDSSLTEELFRITSNELPENTDTLYFLFITSGGSVPHGFAIYSFLKALPYKIIMHNIGNVDSIGNTVFLAGDERYATEHATFLFHKVKTEPKLNLLDRSMVKEKLQCIEDDEKRIADLYKKNTSLSDKEIKDFFDIAINKSAEDAMKSGIIHAIKDIPELNKVVVVKSGNKSV